MRRNRIFLIIIGFWFVTTAVFAVPLSRKQDLQNPLGLSKSLDTIQLSLQDFLARVQNEHPVAKQAQLIQQAGDATLLSARGGFDPKLGADYARKDFKGTEYYDELNAYLKIPTWYGVELKAGVDRNEGTFLNPRDNVPEEGLYSAGVSVNLAQGLLINERMATLKRAQLFKRQSAADRDLMLNQIIFEAALAYFDWWNATQEYILYNSVEKQAIIRLNGVIRSFEEGDKAEIDTVEASQNAQQRILSKQQAILDLQKSRLAVSNYLWRDNVPVELEDTVIPDPDTPVLIDVTLEILGKRLDEFTVENHPKVISQDLKIQQLDVDRRLKANKLLPKLTVEYNFLTPQWNETSSLTTSNYKGGLSFSIPLFLRKERGDLQQAKIKLEDATYEYEFLRLSIRNKVAMVFREIDSYGTQQITTNDLVAASTQLLTGEERKFLLGDSSLFLVNARETKLIESKLKQLSVLSKFMVSKAKLFNSLVVLPTP